MVTPAAMGEDALDDFGETVVGEVMDPEKEVDDDRPADDINDGADGDGDGTVSEEFFEANNTPVPDDFDGPETIDGGGGDNSGGSEQKTKNTDTSKSDNVPTVERDSSGSDPGSDSASQSRPEITVEIPEMSTPSASATGSEGAGGMLGGMDSQTLLVGGLALGGIGLAYAFGGN